MVFFLRTSGLFSSSILIIAGIQITSIQQEEIVRETLFNQVGTISIGLGCFTGPLLFGIASLIDQEPQKEPEPYKTTLKENSTMSEQKTNDSSQKSEHIYWEQNSLDD